MPRLVMEYIKPSLAMINSSHHTSIGCNSSGPKASGERKRLFMILTNKTWMTNFITISRTQRNKELGNEEYNKSFIGMPLPMAPYFKWNRSSFIIEPTTKHHPFILYMFPSTYNGIKSINPLWTSKKFPPYHLIHHHKTVRRKVNSIVTYLR